jgi:hypothetical protein
MIGNTDYNLQYKYISCVTGEYLDTETFLSYISRKNESCAVMVNTLMEGANLKRVPCNSKAAIVCQVSFCLYKFI